MKTKVSECDRIEPDLVASAAGEADTPAQRRVEAHIERCRPCRDDFERYRTIDAAVAGLREAPVPEAAMVASRERLESRLLDLKSRLLTYRVFPSPMGDILIARSELGVALVEYLQGRGVKASRLFRDDVEGIEDGEEIKALHRDLRAYLEGRTTRLGWPLDLRLARSDFQRAVLRATAAVPYGAVTSYAGIAGEIGQPRAVRAVAQALRHNPVPIVVPCHRVIGASGLLTGYVGNRLGLKARLLAVEGVRTERSADTPRVAREALYHYDPNDQREYCLPTCGSIARRPIGRVTLLASRELAETLGFVPCTACRPDLHPIAPIAH